MRPEAVLTGQSSVEALARESGWDARIAGLHERRRQAKLQGGEKNVAKHHAKGKQTIRERIAALLDNGSRFDEIGRIAGSSSEETEGSSGAIQFSPGNFVLGTGPVEGRIVVAAGEDFTMSGGSPNLAGLRKSVYTETLALELQCPLVRLHEGSGGSVGGGRKKAAGAPGRPSTSGLVSKPLRTAWRRCPCAPWRLAAWPGFRHPGLWPRIFLSWCVLPRC